jgi:hypothetical protein
MSSRSRERPDPPPEPDINELIQNDVAKVKRLLGLDVNRLALGSEVEGIAPGGLFGSADYTIGGVNLIEFVNVSTSLGPAQGGSGFPAQVIGLTVTPQSGSDTQLNLAWTATSLPAEFNYYSVYRGPTGFVVGPSFIIAQPVTNSYNNTGLTPGTTYYYRVSLTNDAALEGTASSQVSGTTTGTAPVLPTLDLRLDGNFVDSSTNNFIFTINSSTNGFFSPGQFGSNAWKCNYPTLTNEYLSCTDTANLRLDTTVGFSISVWIYPVTSYTGTTRKAIVDKRDDANNIFTLQIEPTSLTVQFHVRKGGTDYKRQTAAGLTVNAWNHIVGTFNSATNTIAVYKNAVAGNSSTAATQYEVSSTNFFIGAQIEDVANTRIQGYIDEVKYFKGTVLTSTQVTNLMNTNAT